MSSPLVVVMMTGTHRTFEAFEGSIVHPGPAAAFSVAKLNVSFSLITLQSGRTALHPDPTFRAGCCRPDCDVLR